MMEEGDGGGSQFQRGQGVEGEGDGIERWKDLVGDGLQEGRYCGQVWWLDDDGSDEFIVFDNDSDIGKGEMMWLDPGECRWQFWGIVDEEEKGAALLLMDEMGEFGSGALGLWFQFRQLFFDLLHVNWDEYYFYDGYLDYF